MALYQFLCGLTVVISLFTEGCHAQHPACGMSSINTRIIGGEEVIHGSWPWQVRFSLSSYPWCGGSLITNEWVVTAAQCVRGGLQAHLGHHSQSDPNPHEVSLGIDQMIAHPLYDGRNFDNDIALMKLSAPVNFTDFISPICLASANSTFYAGDSVWITGWGVTENGSGSDTLQEVNVPLVGNHECDCAYSHLTANMMCAGLPEGGKDSCQGDGGGPLMTKEGSHWILAGIVSHGIGCALPGYPKVYTRVSHYQDWITNTLGSVEPGFVSFTSTGFDDDGFICPTYPPATNPPDTTEPPTTTTTDGDSVFDSGENVIHFSHFNHFISLCALVLSLYVLVGDA